MERDDPLGADDQQERPGSEQWIVGFVDGEGCFSVPIFRNRSASIGWQVQPEFAVVQSIRSVHVLHDLEAHFGCGHVTINRRTDDHREHMARFAVRRRSDLIGRIIPFFEHNPLRTAKADEFERFKAVLQMMEAGEHLDHEGLRRIAEVAQSMNHRKPSRFLESSEAIRQPTRLRRSS